MLGRVVCGIINLMDETTQTQEQQTTKTQKPIVIKILQWVYLVIGFIYSIVGYWMLKNTSHPSIELLTIILFIIPGLFVVYFYSLVRPNLIIVRFTQAIALIIILGWLITPYLVGVSVGAGLFQVLTTPLLFVSILQIITSFYLARKIRSSLSDK